MSTPCRTLTTHPPSTPYNRQKRAPAADACRIANRLQKRRAWVDSACLIDPTAVCRLCFRLCVISFLKAAAFSNCIFLYSLDRGNLDAQMKNVIHSTPVRQVHPLFNLRTPCWVSGEVLESAELIKDCDALVPSFHLVLLRDFSKVKTYWLHSDVIEYAAYWWFRARIH
jgi:hypothetical protein